MLQAKVTNGFSYSGQVPGLAFQEYNPLFPHKERTLGYAGRPSGPSFYISSLDNTKNHGPGSQQKANPYEADANFGEIVSGYEDVVQKRMRKQVGAKGGNGFVGDKNNHIMIDSIEFVST